MNNETTGARAGDGKTLSAPAGWQIESGKGWISIRNLDSQCGQDFYPDRDPLIFGFLSALAAAPDMRDAYVGAREDEAIWKRRALEAEATARYAPLTRVELDALTCMQAGAPWNCLGELAELFAIYDRLRASGRRPFDPGALSEDESDAYWQRDEFPPVPSPATAGSADHG